MRYKYTRRYHNTTRRVRGQKNAGTMPDRGDDGLHRVAQMNIPTPVFPADRAALRLPLVVYQWRTTHPARW